MMLVMSELIDVLYVSQKAKNSLLLGIKTD